MNPQENFYALKSILVHSETTTIMLKKTRIIPKKLGNLHESLENIWGAALYIYITVYCNNWAPFS